MNRFCILLLLGGLAACDAVPTELESTTSGSSETPVVAGEFAELHISSERGADQPFDGEAISPGNYWIRLETPGGAERHRGRGHWGNGIDSVVFVVDGEHSRERWPPYETRSGDWDEGHHAIQWEVFGDLSDSGSVRVPVGDVAADDPDDPSDPSDPEEPSPENEAPTASFSADCGELTCVLDGSDSSDPDGEIAQRRWDLGDGQSASGEQVEHTFADAGEYQVVLTVTDDEGATDEASSNVSVEESPDSPDDPPLTGIEIEPGTDIQQAVNANPAGTVFVLKAGVHAGQIIRPKVDQAFLGEPGTVLDGRGAAHAFIGDASGVRIEGIEILGYVPPSKDQGAVQCDGCSGWSVVHNEIHDIRGAGVRLGPGSAHVSIRDNVIHTNDNLGVSGFQTTGILLERNELYGNGFSPRSGPGEAAGLKLVGARDAVVRDNHVYDNDGRGIWLDTDIYNALIEDNLSESNALEGIWLEIVCDGAIIRGNTARGNGYGTELQWWPDRAGIQVVNGVNVEIYANTVEDNQNGIAVLGAAGYPTHACKPTMRNISVHDNYVRQSNNGAAAGAVDNFGTIDYSTITFQRNTYDLGSNATFRWIDRTVELDEWRAIGNDDGS